MSNLKVIAKSSLSDKVYAGLRTALMDGQFEAGERLKIGDLAKELDVSITPVREAIFRLVSEKSLVMKASTAVHVPELTVSDLRQIKLIRLALEGATAAAVAENCTPRLLQKMRTVQDNFLEAAGVDAKRASQLNRKFHFLLAEASGMDIIVHSIANMWAMIGPTLGEFHDTVPRQELVGEHRHEAILDALEARDPAAARAAIQHDIEWGDILIQWVAERTAAES
ncbi:MAG: GntR family transcriptional regulator [Rhizobiaceae bacterium]|nr:GntR family transcriptional regulator [Rhizobiaceae bacterium]MBL4732737.1 GntR family transcriptional regulator [Rhizobiaceae bacterium]